jgi:hypothetical protein
MAVNSPISRVTIDPTLSDPTESDEPQGADAVAAQGMPTMTDSYGNKWSALGDLVQSGPATGPDANGGTTVIANGSPQNMTLAEQHAAKQRDGYATKQPTTNDEQRRTRERLRGV